MRALGLFGFLGVSFAALVAMDKITRPVIVKQTEQVRHLINLHQRFRRPIGRFFFFVEERFFCFRRIRCDHYKPLYLYLSLSLSLFVMFHLIHVPYVFINVHLRKRSISVSPP